MSILLHIDAGTRNVILGIYRLPTLKIRLQMKIFLRADAHRVANRFYGN